LTTLLERFVVIRSKNKVTSRTECHLCFK